MDGIAVLEQSDTRLDSSRGADGRLYFYDLGVTRHPSYSVNGHLVHNSSILKQSDGATRTALIRWARDVPFRLACSATPAPNDPEELTSQAEWLGRMTRTNMLAAYFVHDQAGWRMKHHAWRPMMQWMAQWAVALTRPSDVGGDDTGYDLPGLNIVPQIVQADIAADGQLFATSVGGVSGRAKVRKETMAARVDRAAQLVAAEPGPWIMWCGLNAEADALTAAIPGAVNVHGSLDPDEKAAKLLGFADGEFDVLVTKPSIASQGLNYQHCHRMAFVGMGDSYEQYYQAIRRCYRYGQTEVVDAHVIVSDVERQIAANVARKEQQAHRITQELVAEMQRNRKGAA
ncbi:MAG: helicase [Pseudomonas sp.]|nr:helicase [Pseudomonas sp.]